MDMCCKLWISLALSAASIAQGIYVKPSLREKIVLEESDEQIDCYIISPERTANLSWLKQVSQGSYNYMTVTSVEKITDNKDGTFNIHRFLVFPSFTSEDAGRYKCSHSLPGNADEWGIKLIFQKICAPGKYGINCTSACSKFCETTGLGVNESLCHYVNGTCRYGCLPGYMGANCSSVCVLGKYGIDCSSTCSKNCANHGFQDMPWCDHVTGRCLHGCQIGYTSELCTEVCEYGKYGANCSSTCSQGCKGHSTFDKELCHYVTGKCLHGCQDDYTGELCTEAKSDNNNDVGKIVGAVVGVIVLVAVIIIIIVIICKRRHNKRKKHGTDNKDEETQSLTNLKPNHNEPDDPSTPMMEPALNTEESPGEIIATNAGKNPPHSDTPAKPQTPRNTSQPQNSNQDTPLVPPTSLDRTSPSPGGTCNKTNTHQEYAGAADIPDSEEPVSSISAPVQPGPSHSDSSRDGAVTHDISASAALPEDEVWRERDYWKRKAEEKDKEIEQLQAEQKERDERTKKEKDTEATMQRLEAEKVEFAHKLDMAQKDKEIEIGKRDQEIAALKADQEKDRQQNQIAQLKFGNRIKELQKMKVEYERQQKEKNTVLLKKLEERLMKLTEEVTEEKQQLKDKDDILLQMVLDDARDLAAEFFNSNQCTEEEEREHCSRQVQAQNVLESQIEEISEENEEIDRRRRRRTQSLTGEDVTMAEASCGTPTAPEQSMNGNIEEIPLGLRSVVENQINPETILHLFHQYDSAVLSDEDIEAINRITSHEGRLRGADELLDRLSKYPNWLQCLINVLRDPGVKQAYVADPLEGFLKHRS